MAPADLIISYKHVAADGSIVQVRVWRVPSPVRGSAHVFKYSLFFGRDGRRLVAYDNEAGKGDHRHVGDVETPYAFTTIDRLIADFEADIRRYGT